MTPILELRNVSKRFGGLAAVKNVSFTMNEGEIVFVIGPNGAGKTTVFNLVSVPGVSSSWLVPGDRNTPGQLLLCSSSSPPLRRCPFPQPLRAPLPPGHPYKTPGHTAGRIGQEPRLCVRQPAEPCARRLHNVPGIDRPRQD